MANSAFAPGAFVKTPAKVLARLKRAKRNAEIREWRRTCARVDERDGRRCFVTGRTLTSESPDQWGALERHHIRPRSLDRGRRFNHANVVTVSKGVHGLLHAKKLWLLDSKGDPSERFDEIHSVRWDRTQVPVGSEPCVIRSGLRVRES